MNKKNVITIYIISTIYIFIYIFLLFPPYPLACHSDCLCTRVHDRGGKEAEPYFAEPDRLILWPETGHRGLGFLPSGTGSSSACSGLHVWLQTVVSCGRLHRYAVARCSHWGGK